MRGIDTNILVRYLTQDDASQSKRANAIIDGALAVGERLHLDEIVLCELVWVLRSAYGFERSTVARAVSKLLDAAQLSVDDRDLLREAARRYAAAGDFADFVLALRNRAGGCETTLTFDRAQRRSDLFTLV